MPTTHMTWCSPESPMVWRSCASPRCKAWRARTLNRGLGRRAGAPEGVATAGEACGPRRGLAVATLHRPDLHVGGYQQDRLTRVHTTPPSRFLLSPRTLKNRATVIAEVIV